MEFYTKNGVCLLLVRNAAGKITKGYSGAIALTMLKEMFKPINLN